MKKGKDTMKKIISLLLALTLAFSMLALVSCNSSDDDSNGGGKTVEKLAGKTPEELYELSRTKLAAATSYSVDSQQVITMSSAGESMTMNQTVVTKVNGNDSYMKSNNDTESSANMEVWYVDGMIYSSMLGMKIKAEMDKDAYMEEYMGTDPSETTLLDIPESWFENIKFEKEGDKWVLKFVVSGAKYTEVFENVGLGGEITGDVIYKLYFDGEGNIEKMSTVFDMTMMGIQAHCDSVSYIKLENVTITPPADADSYQLTTMP